MLKSRKLIILIVVLAAFILTACIIFRVMQEPYPRYQTESLTAFEDALQSDYPDLKRMTLYTAPLGYQIKVELRETDETTERQIIQRMEEFLASEQFLPDAEDNYFEEYPDTKQIFWDELDRVPKAAMTVQNGSETRELFSNKPYVDWTEP